jgi:hypothetical protein
VLLPLTAIITSGWYACEAELGIRSLITEDDTLSQQVELSEGEQLQGKDECKNDESDDDDEEEEEADEEEDEGNGCADCMDERVSMC